MADFDEKLINEIVDKVKREIIANPRFIASLLKELPISAENIDPNLILSLMAMTKSYKQPPVPRTNKPQAETADKTAAACAKPVLISNKSDTAKIVADILAGNNVYLWGKAGTGKAQPYYSKLLTPTGWITMGDVKAGDFVISDDGKPTKVLEVFERGVKKVYRVHMSDGSYTDTCDEHLWKVLSANQQTQKGAGKVVALKDIQLKRPNGRNDAFIPIVKPVQFKAQKHLIDPYLLGVLLGDGCMRAEYASITNIDSELIEKVSKLIPSGLHLNKFKVDTGKAAAYSIVKKVRNNLVKNIVTEDLKRLGLMYKKSLDKFIPNEYLFDSVENRVKLLQGLNDTDAYASKTCIEFSTSSEKLKNDYVELVQSLGGVCSVTERMPKYVGKNGQSPALSYRVVVKLPNEIVPFSLKRKKATCMVRTQYFPSRNIQRTEYLGDMPTKCISVEAKSHLYVTDDYIVTHNTYLAQAIAECVLRLPQEHIYLINCSQWTSPNEIRGGQTIKGYAEGTVVKAWAYGGMLILDELAKLDPNTAGLLNESLAETAAQPTLDDEGFAIGRTIPKITNGRGEKIYKGQGFRMAEFEKAKKINPSITYPEWYDAEKKKGNIAKIEFEFRFCVVGTGNTDMKTPSKNYSGNQRQDYSLIDRFVGSYYLIQAQKDTEKQLIYGYVYTVCNAMRDFLDTQKDAMESISLRTMLNFNRTYEQEYLTKLESPYADEIYDNDGNRINITKTFKDSVDSFLATLPDELRSKLNNDPNFKMAYAKLPSKEEFECAFWKRYGLFAKKPVTDADCKKYGL